MHKWFARRPGSLYRGLVLSEFLDRPITETYYKAHDLQGRLVADPFMGGGTPLLEANRVGCDVLGADINPMSYWIVKEEITSIDLTSYKRSAEKLIKWLTQDIGELYQTKCVKCGSKSASVKYFLWVRTQKCDNCGKDVDLFPGYLLAENVRHPKNVLVCPDCGELNEVENIDEPGVCTSCTTELKTHGPAEKGVFECNGCGARTQYPMGKPTYKMYAIEYYCSECNSTRKGRSFKKPDDEDIAKYNRAVSRLETVQPEYLPDILIPVGDETKRLEKWGMSSYVDLFNSRQLLSLELSCRHISSIKDSRIRDALATNLSDLLRYQNMLCRYDTMALKSLDIFSIHGFPVGLLRCESNFIGIRKGKINVGSGGWTNIVDKYIKAKSYCLSPFEMDFSNGGKKTIPIEGEWIGETRAGTLWPKRRAVNIICQDSRMVPIQKNSLDAVFTDPPYFGNVQYAELMDFCYVWLKKLVGLESPSFSACSTRNGHEVTQNATMKRDAITFTEGISSVFQNFSSGLKQGSPLAFTYHHNKIEVYIPIAVAILDSGLSCSKVLPCPGEMEGSIHINGTNSSIVDSVFICRSPERVHELKRDDQNYEPVHEAEIDLKSLSEGGMKPTLGDARCIVFGQVIRKAILAEQSTWRREWPTAIKMERIGNFIADNIKNEQVDGLAKKWASRTKTKALP